MTQQTFNNVTIPAAGGFLPGAAGWTDAIFASVSSVKCSATLQAADLNDSSLTLDMRLEYTNDPSGASGWQTLEAETWVGGPQGRSHTAQQPSLGPFSTTSWPAFQRLRVHGIPSRTISGVSVVAQAT